MADNDGKYDCTVKSPLGDQKMTLTVKSDGGTFTGDVTGAMGGMAVNGTVEGNTIAWKQSVSVPMPMTLDCEGTVEGDTLVGSVGAGAFGSFPMSGTRTA